MLQETLIFMDSPGLFAPNRAAIFDAQVLAVLNLLSSVVMYNSMNIIDRSAIEKLSHAVDTGALRFVKILVRSPLSAVRTCNSLCNELLRAGKRRQCHF